jgi:hypothetical protein
VDLYCKNIPRTNLVSPLKSPLYLNCLTQNLEISYIFKYPELKNEADETSWAIRQIGVYQQYSKSTKNSLWVFLHCQQGSRGQRLITELLEQAPGAKSAYKHPVVPHLLLLSCYLYNWQKYMAFYEKELLTRVCTPFKPPAKTHRFCSSMPHWVPDWKTCRAPPTTPSLGFGFSRTNSLLYLPYSHP